MKLLTAMSIPCFAASFLAIGLAITLSSVLDWGALGVSTAGVAGGGVAGWAASCKIIDTNHDEVKNYKNY